MRSEKTAVQVQRQKKALATVKPEQGKLNIQRRLEFFQDWKNQESEGRNHLRKRGNLDEVE